MSGPQKTVDYDIPPYVTDYSAYFDQSKFGLEREAVGGFANVYSGALKTTKFAIKVLRPWGRQGGETTVRKDFNYELSAWLKLGEHTNILKLVGICYANLLSPAAQPCFLSHWQENGQLDNYLKKDPRNVSLLEIVQGVFAGVKHMHGKGVIHGDIRAGNILVSSAGDPLISDFGLSKLIGHESSMSVGAGSVRWMARELLHVEPSPGAEISARRSKASDIWALGMTILELLSGQKPYYDTTNELHVLNVIVLGDKPKFPGVFHASWEPYKDMLLEICQRCWVDNPSERPSIEKLCDDVRNLLDLGSIQSSDDNSSEDSSSTPRARPQDDHAQLLESIVTLNLLSRADALDLPRGGLNESDAQGEARKTEQSNPAPPLANPQSMNPDLGVERSRKQATDGYTIAHMTALLNHLVASKRFRRHTVDSRSEGPSHAPRWYVTISVDGIVHGEAFGPNKSLAQEEAARLAFAAIESEEIDPEVPYLPIFLNRLNSRGSYCRDQFRWKSEHAVRKQGLEWTSTLYWKGIAIGRGKGRSEKCAQGEAARSARIRLNQILLS